MHKFRIALVLALACGLAAAPAQGGFDLMNKVKQKVKQKADQKADQAIDKTLEGAEGAVKPGAAPAAEADAAATSTEAASPAAAADQLKPGEGAWVNYDFRPGNRILYADDFTKDEVGDFPRRMEFVSGTMEIIEWQASRWLKLTTTSKFRVVLPEVLTERYTMEFDFSVPGGEMWIYPGEESAHPYFMIFANGGVAGVQGTGIQARSQHNPALAGKIVHARVLADGPYIKLYVNDRRLANIPNFSPARENKILFYVDAHEQTPAMFGNFRIAAGGKKLYDALAADGRVATQGIYFDTGSDRVRPESSPTLKEIATMLTEHADLKLLIEGHTDNVGQAAANQTLSDKRAAAVKATLVESYGVDGARLQTKGFGPSKPVQSNDTPEGRQMNRRVELVKL